MKINQLNRFLNEERIGGSRASWTNREIKNTIRDLLQMDRYKTLANGKLLVVFMKKFDRYIKQNQLNKSNIREIAKEEIKRQKEKIK